MKKTHLLVPLAAFAVGLASGLWIHPDSNAAAPEPEPTTPPKRAQRSAGQTVNARETAALRARIAELERRLAEEQAEPPQQPVADMPQTAAAPPHESFHERMARLEKEDPARHAQITNRFAMIRRHRLEHAQSRIEFLSSIDTSSMSASARTTHEELQNLIEVREELESRLHDPELPEEDRRKLFLAMRETDRTLNELNRKERKNLLAQMATELGFGGEAARDLTATVNAIINATEDRRHGPPGRRGR